MSKESVQYQEALVYAQSRDYFKKLRYIPEQATRRITRQGVEMELEQQIKSTSDELDKLITEGGEQERVTVLMSHYDDLLDLRTLNMMADLQRRRRH